MITKLCLFTTSQFLSIINSDRGSNELNFSKLKVSRTVSCLFISHTCSESNSFNLISLHIYPLDIHLLCSNILKFIIWKHNPERCLLVRPLLKNWRKKDWCILKNKKTVVTDSSSALLRPTHLRKETLTQQDARKTTTESEPATVLQNLTPVHQLWSSSGLCTRNVVIHLKKKETDKKMQY